MRVALALMRHRRFAAGFNTHAGDNDMTKLKNTLTMDKLAGLFGLPTLDTVYDNSIDYVAECGGWAEVYALRGGATEAEAESARDAAEAEANTEVYDKWYTGVTNAAERLFEAHGLRLVARRNGSFAVKPAKSWDDALTQIRETINGVGYFYFASNREFLLSGPYTPMQAVLSHLHWTADYPAVYGEESAKRTYENACR
jgi:hypothetical protein